MNGVVNESLFLKRLVLQFYRAMIPYRDADEVFHNKNTDEEEASW